MSIDGEDNTLVLIQFSDLDDAKYCQKFSNEFKTLEIASKNPIIQIGNRLYSGDYINNIGTYLFFEQHDKSVPDSTNSTTEKSSHSYNYSGKTFKKLVLNRLFVEEKTKP